MFSRAQSFRPTPQIFWIKFGEAFSCFAIIFVLLTTAIGAEETKAQIGKIRKQAEKAMRGGEFEIAANLWQEVVKTAPDKAEYRLKLAYAYYKSRRYVDSYNEAMEANKIEPENPRVRSILGAIYLAGGRLDYAKTLFRDALLREQYEPLALAGSAMIDYYENRSRLALNKLQFVVEREPYEPDFVYSLAQIAARIEEYKLAAESYKTFLRIAPPADADRRERIKGLITFYNYLGNYDSVYRIEGKNSTTVRAETINNRPVIEVRVNGGKEILRFVLDTGSGMTVISEETAARLKIKPITRGGMARAVGGGGKFEIVYGFLKSLDIGDVRVEKVPVYIRQFNQSGDRFDGYLGLSAISKFIVTLDYGAKTFSLVRNFDKNKTDGSVVSSTGKQIALRMTSSGFLSSEVKIEGVEEPLNFILDTGASVSVVSAVAANRKEISRFENPTVLRVYGAAGVADNVATLILPRLSLGDLSREKIMTAVLDLAPVNETTGFEQAGILGGDFLLDYRLTFDFQAATVHIEPSTAKTKIQNKTGVIENNLPN
jgi:predicted aspartyl protease